MFARSSELGRSNLVKVLRRDGDSNPGNPFGVYTLSRRASSTTRASLLRRNSLATKFVNINIGYKITAFFSYMQEFAHFFAFFCYFMPKRRRAFRFVASIIVSFVTPKVSARRSATCTIQRLSFRSPRCGTGAIYGASVSSTIRDSKSV